MDRLRPGVHPPERGEVLEDLATSAISILTAEVTSVELEPMVVVLRPRPYALDALLRGAELRACRD